MVNENITMICVLVFTILIYSVSLVLTLKYKSNPVFSIRSPLLLLLNNLGGFLMAITYISYNLFDINTKYQSIMNIYCNIFANNYFIFHFLFFFSFALRLHRLIQTWEINYQSSDETNKKY